MSSPEPSPPALALPGTCDCHVHVYDACFPADPRARLHPPDASVADYAQVQQLMGTTRAVLVTPSTYGADNRCMLHGLQALGAAGRGVAVINGQESDEELNRLDALGVRGVRLNLSLGVTGTVDSLAHLAGRIAPLGWHLQLLMSPDLLATLGPVLRRLPVPLVFDHFGRIAPDQAGRHPAHALLLALLSEDRAWVKLSGGYIVSPTRSSNDPALAALAASYLRTAPERVLWGSDWPHPTASAGLQPMPDDAQQIQRLSEWVQQPGLPPGLLHRVLVSNPQTLYGFAPAAQP